MFKLIFFESHTSHERHFLGGKGAALFKLKKKGPYPIPQTFILSSEGIQQWISQFNSFADFKLQWEQNTVSPDHAFYQELKTKAFDLSLNPILKLLSEQFSEGVIVRSSMSVEDHEDFSLAGHFESIFVKKVNPNEIEKSIRQVIISGFLSQNLKILNSYGVHPDEFQVAIVFQPILKATLSGVLFSIDPQSPWEKKAVIEWVDGHLSNLVHGKMDGKIIHEDQIKDLPELQNEIFKNLIELARAAEKVLDKPLDIEWIFDGRDLWIVQARPITQDEVLLSFKTNGKRKWSRELTLERFPSKMTPMGWSSLKTAFQSNIEVLNSRMGILAKNPEDIAIMFRHIIYSDPAFFSFPSGVALRTGFFLNPFRPYLWILLKTGFIYLAKKITGKMSTREKILFKIKVTRWFLASLINDIQRSWRQHVDHSMERAETYYQHIKNKKQLSATELSDELLKMNLISMSFLENDLPIYIIKETFFKLLENLWSQTQLPKESFFELFKGAEGNVTMQMDLEIAKLSGVFKKDPNGLTFLNQLKKKMGNDLASLEKTTQDSWNLFMIHYGHHTVSWDVAMPTWGEDPALIASLLIHQIENPVKAHDQKINLAQNDLDQFKSNYLHEWHDIDEVIQLVRNFMLIDEEQHFLSGRLIPPSRQLILKMGESLVHRSQIIIREDVFFLSLEEVAYYLEKTPINLHALIERRKKTFLAIDPNHAPYELGIKENKTELSENAVRGLAVSPGVIEGNAFWIRENTDWNELPQNFIMLIDSPNPIFIPLYRNITGIVSMSGGYLSHGFVCAREYQLPAVSQIKNLPSLIKNGDLIKVNGSTGQIEIIKVNQ